MMWSLSTSAVGVKKLFAYRICIMYHICIDTLYIDTIRKDLIWHEGITFEQVAAAADGLAGEGQQPTIRAVRERLGTGSPNTIHKHLTAWREARPVAAATAPELPHALAASISAEIERAAAQARGEIRAAWFRLRPRRPNWPPLAR